MNGHSKFETARSRKRDAESKLWRADHSPVPLQWSLLPGVAAFTLYTILAPAVSGDKDGSEFTLVLALNGVAHPTGYPVYSQLGHFFVTALHAFQLSWAKAANLWSALGGAVAVSCLHALSVRLVPVSPSLRPRSLFLLGLLPVSLFALNPVWTYEATLAEVYSWHVAWALGLVLCYAVMAERLLSSDAQAGSYRFSQGALGWGAICGLGLAHHATAVLLILPLTLSLLWMLIRRHTMSPGILAAFAVCLALPLTSYVFVAWRAFHPAVWQWPTLAPAWSGILGHITGAEYGHLLGSFNPSEVQRGLLEAYVYPVLFPALLILTVAGITSRDAVGRPVLRTLALVALLHTVFSFAYGVPDPSPYFLTPMAIALSGLLCAGWELARRGRRVRRLLSVGTGALAIAMLFLAADWTTIAAQRRSVLVEFDRLVRSMWHSIPYEQAIVLWPNDMSSRLLEYQLLHGEKPGISILNPLLLARAHPREQFIRRHGFDPAVRVGPPRQGRQNRCSASSTAEEFVVCVSENINDRSSLPVIMFDPEHQSVRLLRKGTETQVGDSPGEVR